MSTISNDPVIQLDVMREQISSSLEKARTQKNRLKRDNGRYMTANIVLGAIAAVLAGAAGTVGKAETWKPICLLATVCSIGATVTAKIQTAEQLTEACEFVAQLKALRVETMAPTYDLEDVSEKYKQILARVSTIDI
ncbi:MAG: hypothetical protein KME42_22485 [Tildeniella nuda ZEHNDER 1965/U140]|jgi:hypothetical protein|nr:hypothetical protein [Tildeniella nuda ZEHNDER 1965/U140]